MEKKTENWEEILPYEKFEKMGPQSLTDAELLAIIIRTGTKDSNSIELGKRILSLGSKSGQANGILSLQHLSLEELMEVKGIGKVKAIQLKCIAELSNRITATRYMERISLRDARSIAIYFMEKLRHERQEQLVVCMFDSKCRLLAEEVVSKGSVNSSIVPPREIFITALQKHAVHIVLLHNHPSGICEPSEQDLLVTQRLKEAGQMIGIDVIDHIIIGEDTYYSFRENQIF